MLDTFFPVSQITLSNHDPPFVTPAIKSILRKRNKLMHAGKLERAEACTDQVSRLIAKANCSRLAYLNGKKASKTMWSEVRKSLNTQKHSSAVPSPTADVLNDHYARVSTDPNYIISEGKSTCSQQIIYFTEQSTFWMLDHLQSSSAGPDGVPSWFLRLAAPIIASPLAWLLNLSLNSGTAPLQWKSALITPIAKIPNPVEAADFRPISVTSILSRCTEKDIVRRFIYQCMRQGELSAALGNQFAYRPSGSTSAAIISLLQAVTSLLENQPYVRLIALDFSKAFDTLKQSTLIDFLAGLDLPDNIFNWLVDFFRDRSHRTKRGANVSNEQSFNAGVVQGSAIGPAAFILCSSGLQPANQGNLMFKYADDCYFLIPANNSHTVSSELENVSTWAVGCNLKLNLNKTKEIIIRSKRRSDLMQSDPPSMPGVERSTSMVVLGVTLSNNLSMDVHISTLSSTSASSMYGLKTLKRFGMKTETVSTVCRATLVAKLSYCAPAWRGLLSKSDIDRLEAILRRAERWGLYASQGASLSSIMDVADDRLFQTVLRNPYHVLHQLLPPVVTHPHNLRQRSHNRSLLQKTALSSTNFFIRMLYQNSY
jgi:hypothetical protein